MALDVDLHDVEAIEPLPFRPVVKRHRGHRRDVPPSAGLASRRRTDTRLAVFQVR